MPNKTPYVTAALICEKILEEKDNVLTAVRIVDTITAQRPPQPSGVVQVVQLSVLVMLKSGDLTGPSEISLKLRSPSGKITDIPQKYPSVLMGGVHGQNLAMGLLLELKDEFGLYWIDVYWNGEILTNIPFNLVEAPPVAMKQEKT
jgi:hypothetical protein